MNNQSKKTARWLIALTVVGAAGAAVWTTWLAPAAAPPAQAQTSQNREWRTAAPGIVEAQVADVKLAAATQARIINIAVKAGDRVNEGDLLVQLDDKEEAARVRMAEANVTLRKVDADSAAKAVADRRQSEERIPTLETALRERQAEVDAAEATPRNGPEREARVRAAQTALASAQEALAKERQTLAALVSADPATTKSRADAMLAVANAELSLAQAALAKTRITAPFSGTVLKLLKTRGEMASPSVEDAILTFGDHSHLRVRAELSELDIGRVKVQDRVTVVSDALNGRPITGRVASVANSLGPRRIGANITSGPLWPSVREVIVELDDASALIPGLHVDVFFGSPQS